MMSGKKRNGPRAVAAARKAKVVASVKSTKAQYLKPLPDASAYARAWVARRYRVRSRWAGVIAEAAGLGGRA
jgi:hypothetical protein